MEAAEALPVSIITGFLGSGKTTLLSRLLRHPDMGRTAVIINEFGEIGIDHDLVASSSEDTVLMASGCVCCTIRGDLVNTLRDLYIRRVRGEVPEFERVLIETTGLADPAPILHTLMADPMVEARYRLDGVIATVDAVNGDMQLDRHIESVKQVAMADRLLLTKADLAQDPASRRDLAALKRRLAALNPGAPVHEVMHGEIDPGPLFNAGLYNPLTKTPDVARWLKDEAYDTEGHHHDHHHDHDHHHGHDHNHNHAHRHDDSIKSFCLFRDEPLPWQIWVEWLQALIATRGNDILRIKGILNVEGLEGPVAVHGVQHLFHQPVMLDVWPSESRRSRIVFITQNVGREAVEQMLDAWAEANADQPPPGRP